MVINQMIEKGMVTISDHTYRVRISDLTLTSHGSEISDTARQRPCTKRGDVGDVGSGPAIQAKTRRYGKILAPLRGPITIYICFMYNS
jgi:hypothetical protein